MSGELLAMLAVGLGTLLILESTWRVSRNYRRDKSKYIAHRNYLNEREHLLRQKAMYQRRISRQISTLRALRAEDAVRFSREFKQFQRDLARIHEIEMQLKAQQENAEADIERESSNRVVEVVRKDGSTVSIGVDPRNADSIRGFLDNARRNSADRVIAVH